jgi:hypothetical protein
MIIDTKTVYLGDGAKISVSKYSFKYPVKNKELQKVNTIANVMYTINTSFTADIDLLAAELIKVLSANYYVENIKEISPISMELEESWSIRLLESNNFKFYIFYRFDFPPCLNILISYNN